MTKELPKFDGLETQLDDDGLLSIYSYGKEKPFFMVQVPPASQEQERMYSILWETVEGPRQALDLLKEPIDRFCVGALDRELKLLLIRNPVPLNKDEDRQANTSVSLLDELPEIDLEELKAIRLEGDRASIVWDDDKSLPTCFAVMSEEFDNTDRIHQLLSMTGTLEAQRALGERVDPIMKAVREYLGKD